MYLLPALFLLLTASAAHAVEFGMPLRCSLGTDCWIPRYVDHDPGPGAKDYRCGPNTGDGHKGTDFALPNYAVMERGVAVKAVLDGQIRAARDGMADVNVKEIDRSTIEGRECGNGVLIAHTDGLETQYCHLMKGSIAVQPGDMVQKGQILGSVGLSGDTSFPHVHLTVRRDGRVIDPFLGIDGLAGSSDTCRKGEEPLWEEAIMAGYEYRSVIIRNIGFADRRISWQEILAGALESPPERSAETTALVVAFDGFRIQENDRIEVLITGPDGWRHEHQEVVENSQAEFMRFSGTRAPANGFQPGAYEAEIRIERPDLGMVASERARLLLN